MIFSDAGSICEVGSSSIRISGSRKAFSDRILGSTLYIPLTSLNSVIFDDPYAPDVHGKIRTFGRNSSDLSAVAFAGAYGSSNITLFKDVNGIYNVDPKILSEKAFLYEVLSHDAAITIASGGSKIVHPAAIELAKNLSLDIRVRNFVHKSTPEGTLITSNY